MPRPSHSLKKYAKIKEGDLMRKIFYLLLVSTMIWACSTSGSNENGDEAPSFDTSGHDTSGDVMTDTVKQGPTKVDESFRVAFLYMGRLGSHFYGRTDLFVMDSLDPRPVNITGKLSWSCQDGCILSPDFDALGVFIVYNDPKVLPDLKIYALDKDMKPGDRPVRVIKGVNDAHLAQNVLYFTRAGSCPQDQAITNTYCMYKIASPLDKNSKETELFTFPRSTQDAENSVFSGRFRVTSDGKTLLLLRPTIYSQEVFVWRNGKILQVGKEVCHQKTAAGACTGTGSEYSDMDPLGISPDSSVIMAALLEQNRDLRLRKYEMNTDLTTRASIYSDFYGVSGPFTQMKCSNPKRQPWQYTDIKGDLRFTGDAKSVVFIASMNCGDNKEKPWTDIVKIDVDRIGTGKPLTRDSIFRITHNPQHSSSKATKITDFKFSPSGKYIAFIGTPLFQTDGKTPVSSTGTRHLDDREIFFIAADGSTLPVQVTNSLDYMAVSLWVR